MADIRRTAQSAGRGALFAAVLGGGLPGRGVAEWPAVGAHEGGETPFVLDVTDAIKPGEGNRLAVRVLNPKHEPIDGIALNATPHRNKALPYRTGSAWDQGGIVDSVELCVKPPVYVADLWARPDWRTGLVHVQATLHNFLSAALGVQVEFTVAPAASGETVAVERTTRPLPSGDTLVEAQLRVPSYRLVGIERSGSLPGHGPSIDGGTEFIG